MADKESIERIGPQAARSAADAGEALIVCAYEKEARCKGEQIQGALTKQALDEKSPEMPKDQQIIFY